MGFIEQISNEKNANRLRQILGERFAKNRNFFSKVAPELLKFLQTPPTKFGLIADERGVNLVNIQNGTLVYGYDGVSHKMIETNLAISNDPFANSLWQTSSEGMDVYEIGEKFKITNDAANTIRANFEKDPRFMPDLGACHLPSSFLPPVFCYGLGSGIFLEDLNDRFEFIQSIFIYEPEADFFTASCHFVDYEALHAKINTKLLGIFIEEEPKEEARREFFAKQRITASFTKLELTLYESPILEGLKAKIALDHSSNTRGWGTYEDEMIGVSNHLRNFKSLNIPTLTKFKKIDAPICVIGNGASLDQSIDFIKQNQDKMVIFSAGTSLRTLKKYGIKPDFQIEIERLDYLAGVLNEAGLEDIPLLASNVVHPTTFALAKEKYAFFRDFTASSYFKEPKQMLHYASPYVGNAAVALAVNFASTVILCGLDVGYKKNSARHSKDSIYKDELELSPDSVIVEPNFNGSEIYSNPLYKLSNFTIGWAIDAQKNVKVYNLSDGAKIASTISAHSIELGAINKGGAINRIKNCFEVNDIYQNIKTVPVKEQLKEYADEMSKILNIRVVDKKDLFCALDIFMAFLDSQYPVRPAASILFGGSLKHLAFLLFMNSLHINGNNIEANYAFGVRQIIRFMKEAIAEFEAKESSSAVSSILKKIKGDA